MMASDSLPSFPCDSKYSHNMDNEKGNHMSIRTPARRIRPLAIGFMVVAILYYIWASLIPKLSLTANYDWRGCMPNGSIREKPRVPLEAHIMSKCPDARDCLKMLVLPTMQRVIDKVNFTLSYIGTPTENDGVACMHGPEECMGNIIELCAADLYPDPKIYLGFTMCLSKDYTDIPQRSLIEDCALEHSLDFSKLNECAAKDDGGYAMGMLRDSVRRSKDAGVTKSCTVRLDEQIYCVRDDGEWKECPNGAGVNDLVIAVERLYQSS